MPTKSLNNTLTWAILHILGPYGNAIQAPKLPLGRKSTDIPGGSAFGFLLLRAFLLLNQVEIYTASSLNKCCVKKQSYNSVINITDYS